MDRIIKAFNNSITGLIIAFEKERAFRESALVFALLFPLALFSHLSGLEKAVLIMSLFFILIAQLINAATQAIAERVLKDMPPLAKIIKDTGGAFVLISFANAIIAWGLIYLQ